MPKLPKKNAHAQAMAHKRALSLSPERRREIARMGGIARWQKAKQAVKKS